MPARSNSVLLGAIAAILLGAPSLPAQAPEDPLRFLHVEKFHGRFLLSATASGTIDNGLSQAVYLIERRVDVSLELTAVLPDNPIVQDWYGDITGVNSASQHDVTNFTGGGCSSRVSSDGAGALTFEAGGDTLARFQLGLDELGGPLLPLFDFPGVLDTVDHTLSGGGASCHKDDYTSATTHDPFPKYLILPHCPDVTGFPIECLDLPDQGLSILQVWDFDFDEFPAGLGIFVPVHYTITLELAACANDPELEVSAEGYDDWLPEAKDGEREEGNRLSLVATLQSKGGCPTPLRVRRFTFELQDISSEPGVCMNYPTAAGAPPAGLPDLGFLTARNPAPWLPSGDPSIVLESEDGEYTKSPPAVLSSFDWGGSASVKVTAELIDGRKVVGHLKGDDNATLIPIPKRKDGSRIGDTWKTQSGVSDLPDDDDGETIPAGDGHPGDGLTLYEEYRGFYQGAGRAHVRGNPKKKDLFIVDEAGAQAGIALLSSATKLEVHGDLRLGQLSSERLINANRSGKVAGASDQHGLIVLQRPLGASIRGQAVGGPGLPKSVSTVLLTTTFDPRSILALGAAGSLVVNEKLSITAHEILHACNVYHHGSSDRPQVTFLAAPRAGGFDYTENGAVVSLAEEGDCGARQAIEPADATDHLLNAGVATQGGQHSGNEDCVMRYSTAVYYEDSVIGGSYWHHRSDETPGFIICGSASGTGVNASGHCPQPRYGDATAGCCLHQICVNDRRDHAAKAGPTACAAGGGGESEPGSGAGGAVDEPRPILSLTLDEGMTVQIRRGRPALLVLEVVSSQIGAEGVSAPLVLAAAGGWTSAVAFRLARDGAPLPLWPLVPLAPAPDSISLTERGAALAAWWISPETTAAIEPGTYSLDSILDTTGAVAGWSGSVLTEPVAIEVSGEPSPLTPPNAAEKALAAARYLVWQGKLDEALAIIDGLLADDPANATAHWFRAEILEAKGDDAAAVDAYRAALNADQAAEADVDEVPGAVQRGYATLLARIEGGTPAVRFQRGDANADGGIDLSDAVRIVFHLFFEGAPPLHCEAAADLNDDGAVEISDAVFLLNFMFLEGTAPSPPLGICGRDPTPDGLTCGSFSACP